ncbi:MAG: alpha/beta hydrolase [Planctomycetota bacterium]
MTQAGDDEKVKDDRQPATDSSTKRKRPRWVSLIRFLALTYGLILILMAVFEERLLFPGAYFNVHPANPMAPVADFEYESPEGTRITGRLLKKPYAAHTVLFLHGNGITASALDPWVIRLSDALNANVLAAEYSGYQASDVRPGEDNLLADSLAAHEALAKRFNVPPEKIIVYGRSLGGGCATHVASQKNTECLILERTFDSAKSVAAAKYPIFPIRWLMRNEFDSVSRLANFQGRVLQIHGTGDRLIPIGHGQRLFESIPSSRKRFITIPGLGHNAPLSDEVMNEVRDFVRE